MPFGDVIHVVDLCRAGGSEDLSSHGGEVGRDACISTFPEASGGSVERR
jgi:hypothetical protein